VATEHFLSRFTGGVGLLYFLFVLWLIVLFIIYTFAWRIIHKFVEIFIYIICCGGQGKAEADEQRDLERARLDEMGLDSYSNNILEDYSLGGLAKMFKRAKDEYEDIQKIKAEDFKDESTKSFGEAKMKQRLASIASAIRSHIRILIYETGNEHEQELIRMSPEMQLKVLLMNVQTVQTSSESRNLKALRMSGVNQSYDMFDGRVYHSAQIMKHIVAKEKQELGADYATANESISAPLMALPGLMRPKTNTVSVAPAPAAAASGVNSPST